MDLKNYTTKAQEIIQLAAQLAIENGQQSVENGHLLKKILEEDDNASAYLLNLGDNEKNVFSNKINEIVNGYPRVSGGNQQSYLGSELQVVLANAQKLTKEFEDDYVSMELLLLSMLQSKDSIGNLLKTITNEKKIKRSN